MMRVARNCSEECEVKIGDEIIEKVDARKYLGVMISSDGSTVWRRNKYGASQRSSNQRHRPRECAQED